MKTHKKYQKKRPKNVWNSVRKLEGYLRKADIQANVFLDSLQELREEITLEVSASIVRKLCTSVNGDILNGLVEHKKRMEVGKRGNSIEQNVMLTDIFDTLTEVLDLSPVRKPGERFLVTREKTKEYVFEEHPEALLNESVEHLEVEVLRSGGRSATNV